MSNRGAEGSAAKQSSGAGERRTNAPQRVHFEALVAMADEGGGSGFEAESVDVSTSGMRLRTAYLPPIGEKLVCRFDGAGSEISATGEVIWRNELARGGEFGLRFTDLDRDAESALRSMCVAMNSADSTDGAEKGDKDPSMAAAKGSSKGTRVRLHIEGLGSPMKARVREADTGEVLVGSNLEFLRVGRSLELEDVDQGVRREAHIDHVKVDIDPETHIPQLVVSLRYSEKAREGAGKAAAAAIVGAAGAATAAGEIAGRAESAGGEKRLSRPGDEGDSSPRAGRRSEPQMRPSRPSQAPAKTIIEEEAQSADAEGNEDSDEGRADKLRGFGTKAAAVGKNMAGKVGPSLAAASAKTKSAVLGFVAALQKKRAERAEAQQSSTPRRMTAPPPTGALRPQGRKLVRDENGNEEDEETPLPPRGNKRAAIVGSALGLFAVLAVFGMTRFFGPGAATQAGASADSQGQTAALTAGTSAPGAPGATAGSDVSPTGVLTAEVPLFGATPLSTTEPVPSGLPDPAALGSAQPADPLLAGMPPGAATPGANGGDPSGDPALDDPSEGGDESAGGGEQMGSKEYGQGKVRSPNVLRIKMDGPVEVLNGASGAMGFTISLPGRRSLSTSSSELALKDKRIASLQVVNNAHGAEVTVQFKDGIPAYRAKAKGDKLEIALGTERKVASKAAGEKKKAPAAKKKADAKKKAPAKKDAPKKDAKKTTKKKASAD